LVFGERRQVRKLLNGAIRLDTVTLEVVEDTVVAALEALWRLLDG
jgi:hypothetical protein